MGRAFAPITQTQASLWLRAAVMALRTNRKKKKRKRVSMGSGQGVCPRNPDTGACGACGSGRL